MEHGVPLSFTKLYTINAQDKLIIRVLGFRKTGAPIIEIQDDGEKDSRVATLAVYDPASEEFSEIRIIGIANSFIFHSYMETLVLI